MFLFSCAYAYAYVACVHDPETFRVFSGLETNEEYQTHRPTKLRFRVKIAKIRRLKT